MAIAKKSRSSIYFQHVAAPVCQKTLRDSRTEYRPETTNVYA